MRLFSLPDVFAGGIEICVEAEGGIGELVEETGVNGTVPFEVGVSCLATPLCIDEPEGAMEGTVVGGGLR